VWLNKPRERAEEGVVTDPLYAGTTIKIFFFNSGARVFFLIVGLKGGKRG
jgi:hypothetical protein